MFAHPALFAWLRDADVPAGLQAEQRLAMGGPLLSMGVLGGSGVGKSTLLDVLASDHVPILPHGGVGPLTAHPTHLRYAEEPYFRATYDRTVAERAFQALQRAKQVEVAPAVSPTPSSSPTTRRSSRVPDTLAYEEAQRIARLMVLGRQFRTASDEVLSDGLRHILGRGDSPIGLDPYAAGRLQRLRDAVRQAAGPAPHMHLSAGADHATMRQALRDHAAGFLAPLTTQIEVGWNSSMLRAGLELVDLPGLGVANDHYRDTTHRWVATAAVLLLVVDKSGITEEVADLLASTGFLRRLFDPSEARARLAVVLVKIDDLVSAERSSRRTAGRAPGGFSQVLREVRDDAELKIRGQIVGLVSQMGPVAWRCEHVMQDVLVHAVSAVEHRRHVADDPDDRPRTCERAEAGIMALRWSLERLAQWHARRWGRAVQRIMELSPVHGCDEDIGIELAALRALWESRRHG